MNNAEEMLKSLIILCFVLAVAPSGAKELLITDKDLSAYPEVSISFLALDDFNKTLSISSPGLVHLLRDGIEVPVSDTWCEGNYSTIPVSVVLMLDISSSMKGLPLDMAKSAANVWIEALDLNNSEIAIGAFNSESFLVHDFSADKQSLRESVYALTEVGGTSFNAALIEGPASALNIAKRAKHRPVIIVVTDGIANGRVDDIITEAGKSGIAINALLIKSSGDGGLKNICVETGGRYFQGLKSVAEAVNSTYKLIGDFHYKSNCILKWTEEACPQYSTYELVIDEHKLSADFTLDIDESFLPELEFSPSNLISFGISENKIEGKIKLTARNRDVYIKRIVPEKSEFRVLSPSFPRLLRKNKSIDVSIEYTPPDTAYRFTRFTVDAAVCKGSGFYAHAGSHSMFGGEGVRIVKPNGGEVFQAGSKIKIGWENVSETEEVELSFSSDRGAKWGTISANAIGLEHIYTAPDIDSDNCLVRAGQYRSGEGGTVVFDYSEDDYSVDFQNAFWPDSKRFVYLLPSSYRFVSNNASKDLQDLGVSEQLILNYTGKDDLLAVKTYNDGIRIFNTKNGQFLKSLSGSNKETARMEFNYSGDLLAIAEATNNSPDILIWNVQSGGQHIHALNGHSETITDFDFSHDSKMLVSAAHDGKIYKWNISGGLPEAIYNDKTDKCNAIGYSPQVFFASGHDSGALRIWSFSSELISFSPRDGVITELEWNNTGNMLAIGYEDGFIKVIDPVSGETFKDYIKHTGEIISLEFSENNDLLSCGLDSTIVFWQLGNIVNSDESDAPFSIKRPALTLNNIDFGEAYVGETKDTLMNDYIINNNSFSLIIDSITFADGQFYPAGEIENIKLETGEIINLKLFFEPQSATDISGEIFVHSANAVFNASLSGKGINPPIEVEAGLINFGSVTIGSEKRDSLKILNKSGREVTISEISQNGPDMEQFIYLQQHPINLQAGGEAFIKASFTPIRSGAASGSLLIYADEAPEPLIAALYGVGSDTGKSVSISVNYIKGDIGDIVPLEVKFESTGDEALSDDALINVKIKFNASIMAPLYKPESDVVIDGMRVFPVTASGEGINTDTTISTFFTLTLGNTDTSSLRIDEILQQGDSATIIINDAAINVLDICREGGGRFVDGSEKLEIDVKTNNETNLLNIHYSLIEKGKAEFNIYSITGEIAGDFVLSESKGIGYKTINVEMLPPGVYAWVLKTPTIIRTGKFILVN